MSKSPAERDCDFETVMLCVRYGHSAPNLIYCENGGGTAGKSNFSANSVPNIKMSHPPAVSLISAISRLPEIGRSFNTPRQLAGGGSESGGPCRSRDSFRQQERKEARPKSFVTA